MKNKSADDQYKPVPHNQAFKKQLLADPEVKAAYNASGEKYALAVELIAARKKAKKKKKKY